VDRDDCFDVTPVGMFVRSDDDASCPLTNSIGAE
jgi:hypothetical protein